MTSSKHYAECHFTYTGLRGGDGVGEHAADWLDSCHMGSIGGLRSGERSGRVFQEKLLILAQVIVWCKLTVHEAPSGNNTMALTL
jgi:hypothetical protein